MLGSQAGRVLAYQNHLKRILDLEILVEGLKLQHQVVR